jgi:DNA-binding NarL/FixJ family response regulator
VLFKINLNKKKVSKVKIIIADSHFLSRKGLAILLKEIPEFELISEALSASDLVDQSKYLNPDLIIIDYTSSNYSLDGLKQVVKNFPHAHFLAIANYQNNRLIAKALNSGVTSHLLKDCEQEEVVDAIFKTAKGEKILCGRIASAVLENGSAKNEYSCAGLNISDREMEIIKLIAEGLSNKEVADKLFLSTHTVTTHRKNIMNKLGVNNTAGLVMFAVREDLISPNHFLFASN